MADHVGMFAVTTGIGIRKKISEFEANHDDYNSILLKALADRLAEAFAERLHERVRKEFWGYAGDEQLASRRVDCRKVSRHPPRPWLSWPAPTTPRRVNSSVCWKQLVGLALN